LKKNFYSYGSSAYDYSRINLELNKNISREIKINHTRSDALPALIIFLFIIMTCSLTMLSINSSKTAKLNEIARLNQELRTLKANTLVLQETISQKHDLLRIKEIAEKKLNMHAPYEYQIIYIKLDKKS